MTNTRGEPEPRSVAFTPDGSLLIAYLEHGISYVRFPLIATLCLLLLEVLDTGWQDPEVELSPQNSPHVSRAWLIVMYPHRTNRSGRFCYNPRKNTFLVHNLYDGFDAYKIKGSTIEHFRSYQVATQRDRNVTLSCLFIDRGASIILGTTMGKAMIVDTDKASTKQLLLHSGM